MRLAACMLILALAASQPLWAETSQRELAENQPVAIVAQVYGRASLRRLEGPWRPVYWLDLLRPTDQIETGSDAKVVALYFFDDHLEVVDPGTRAQVNFKKLERMSGEGSVRRHPSQREVVVQEIPYLLMRRLKEGDFRLADEPGAYGQEEIFLSARVKNTTYPPVFYCADLGLPEYRFQFFNEQDEFMAEYASSKPRFKFPFAERSRLTKGGLYYWQVLGPDDRIVVRKVPFIMLTAFHAREIERAEKRFERLKERGEATTIDTTDLFLLYNRLKVLDKSLDLLRNMIRTDPDNPILYRALTRIYLEKGCPAHARQAWEKEIALGGTDPIEK